VAALASDRRNPVGDAERRFVLDRLVDEELLVQRALELGLARSDRVVRSQLVSALIEAVTADASLEEPTPDALRRFFTEHADWFRQPGRLHARQLFVREGAGASDRAALAAARLREGEGFESVARALGDEPLAPLPDAPLPAAKLAEYAGPAALEALREQAVGAVGDPLAAAGGYQVLVLVAREPDATPAFEAVEEAVRAEWRRRAGDEALRRYVETLRAGAEIRVAGSAPRAAVR
jgi:hypothetical protein